jgi:signal transduction histidine kinase
MGLHQRLGHPRLPRRTVRMRLTLLYGALFLLSGAGLLATTYVLVQHATLAGRPAQSGDNGASPAASTVSGPMRPQLDKPTREAVDRQRDEQLHQLLIQSGIALGLMSVVSIGLGWVVAGRVLRPLRTITATAREISATNLDRRLTLQGPDDELKELGDTFDGLLARLDASFQSQRRFIANTSHELRTPLALQRTLLQLALSDPEPTVDSLRRAYDGVLGATYQQERLIDALLTLARGELGLDRRRPCDLAEVAEEALLSRTTQATDRDIRLVSTLDGAPTEGDPHLVERLVANLVDNALRYNTVAGQVEVTTGTTAEGALLSVSNTGPPVPADQLDRLFQPFQRLGAERTRHDGGLGLGLSIVQAIATAHAATVRARSRAGGGLEVRVTFPRAGQGPPTPD